MTDGHGYNNNNVTTPAGSDHPLAATAANYSATYSSTQAPSAPPRTLQPPPPPPPPAPPVPSPPPAQPPVQHHAAAAPVSAPPPGTYQTMSSSSTTTRSVPSRTMSGSSSSGNKPLDGMVDEFLSVPSYRTETLRLEPILRPPPLPKEDGAIQRLRTLVERRAWGDVLKMSTTILNSTTSEHAAVYCSLVALPLNAQAAVSEQASTVPLEVRSETVEVMILQCHAWLKLRRYNDLSAEIERWNFLVQNDAASTSPPWLPWSIHILAAQTQEYTKNLQQSSTDILYNLRQRIADSHPNADQQQGHKQSSSVSSSAVPIWLVSVDNALANIFVRRQEWRQALGSWDRVIQLLPNAVMAEINIDATGRYGNMSVNDVAFTLEKAYKCEIMSRQGRVLLQAGAIYEATQIFDLARNTWSDEIEPTLGTLGMEVKDHPVLKGLPSLMKVNEGLSFFSKSRYDRALQCFTTAIDNLRKQDRIHPQYRVEDWVGPSIATCIEHSTLYSESVGNMALCHLYECRMEEAVALMEGLIREDPTAFLTERVIFNLCTLYELGSDSTVGTRKKRVLQLIAKRFFLHDVGPESFRIN